MSRSLTIALDAMGGDEAPHMVVDGAHMAHGRHPSAHFLFFGDEAQLTPALARYPALRAVSDIHHTLDRIDGGMAPSQALRKGRNSSMGLAIDAVKQGQADVAVSAGNTGALMALAKFTLRTMPGIERPALVGLLPTLDGDTVMLDLGANVACDAENLLQFAIMGAAFAQVVMGKEQPRVALLNIGTEDLKGRDEIREAADILRQADLPLAFEGFVEGDGIMAGAHDVVVCDGFTGNVALKTTEGTARLIATLLRQSFRKSWVSRLGYFFAQTGLKALRAHLDPNNHNGGVMLGLNGLVVKSHGGANAAGFASALSVAYNMAAADLCQNIGRTMEQFSATRQPLAQAEGA